MNQLQSRRSRVPAEILTNSYLENASWKDQLWSNYRNERIRVDETLAANNYQTLADFNRILHRSSKRIVEQIQQGHPVETNTIINFHNQISRYKRACKENLENHVQWIQFYRGAVENALAQYGQNCSYTRYEL